MCRLKIKGEGRILEGRKGSCDGGGVGVCLCIGNGRGVRLIYVEYLYDVGGIIVGGRDMERLMVGGRRG